MKNNLNKKLLRSFSLFSFLKTTSFLTVACFFSLAELIYSRVALMIFFSILAGGC